MQIDDAENNSLQLDQGHYVKNVTGKQRCGCSVGRREIGVQ